jgi:hypothetical protein
MADENLADIFEVSGDGIVGNTGYRVRGAEKEQEKNEMKREY